MAKVKTSNGLQAGGQDRKTGEVARKPLFLELPTEIRLQIFEQFLPVPLPAAKGAGKRERDRVIGAVFTPDDMPQHQPGMVTSLLVLFVVEGLSKYRAISAPGVWKQFRCNLEGFKRTFCLGSSCDRLAHVRGLVCDLPACLTSLRDCSPLPCLLAVLRAYAGDPQSLAGRSDLRLVRSPYGQCQIP
ncbi:hypothetical protein AYL99_00420 [Fonsecaea erecta]|uniref:Uncharacterized protein n=1 Tax=Fonsecaea erecta TaxID=1367422 RepID=A0A178ZX85_9EURO|nr:hypothetical protein AYL99_00420 [Fonsecaea erecta]OAP64448.1 hypothetical protein AYL99_00420 [Fonsecaea erecta]